MKRFIFICVCLLTTWSISKAEEILLVEIPMYSPQDSGDMGNDPIAPCRLCFVASIEGNVLKVEAEVLDDVHIIVRNVLTNVQECETTFNVTYERVINVQGVYHIELQTSDIALEGYFEVQ